MMTNEITIAPDGRLSFIWDDSLAGLVAEGQANIRRVSDVEPDEADRWFADLGRVGGPRLGPFALRGEAIKAEVDWILRSFDELRTET